MPPIWAVTWQINQQVEPPELPDSSTRPIQRAVVTSPNGVIATKDWLLPWVRVSGESFIYTVCNIAPNDQRLIVYDQDGNELINQSLPLSFNWVFASVQVPLAISPVDGVIFFGYYYEPAGPGTFGHQMEVFNILGDTLTDSWSFFASTTSLVRACFSCANNGDLYFGGYDPTGGDFTPNIAAYRRYSPSGTILDFSHFDFNAFPSIDASRTVEKFWANWDGLIIERVLGDTLNVENQEDVSAESPFRGVDIAVLGETPIGLYRDLDFPSLAAGIQILDQDGLVVSSFPFGDLRQRPNVTLMNEIPIAACNDNIFVLSDSEVGGEVTIRRYDLVGNLLSEWPVNNQTYCIEVVGTRFF